MQARLAGGEAGDLAPPRLALAVPHVEGLDAGVLVLGGAVLADRLRVGSILVGNARLRVGAPHAALYRVLHPRPTRPRAGRLAARPAPAEPAVLVPARGARGARGNNEGACHSIVRALRCQVSAADTVKHVISQACMFFAPHTAYYNDLLDGGRHLLLRLCRGHLDFRRTEPPGDGAGDGTEPQLPSRLGDGMAGEVDCARSEKRRAQAKRVGSHGCVCVARRNERSGRVSEGERGITRGTKYFRRAFGTRHVWSRGCRVTGSMYRYAVGGRGAVCVCVCVC